MSVEIEISEIECPPSNSIDSPPDHMEIDDESEKTEAVEENYHINRIKDRILNNTLANRTVRMLYDQ